MMKKISLGAVAAFILAIGHLAQAAANENPAHRLHSYCLPFLYPGPHSGRSSAILGTWGGKTLSLSLATQRENSIASPRLRPS